jgi:predicted esterase
VLRAFQGGWNEPGLVLIAPKSKGQTWSLIRSQEDHDLESVNLALAEAYERCRIDRSRIGVGGFSDGATYALTLGISNGDLFRAIMALSPGGIIGGEQVGVPRVFVSHGTLDDVLPIAQAGDAVVRELRDAGYSVTYRRFRGGHGASMATSAAAVRWFLAGA